MQNNILNNINIKQEIAFTRKRIEYNNFYLHKKDIKDSQMKYIWNETPQRLFYDRLHEKDFSQVLSPVKLDINNATDFLFQNPDLNKIHSCYLDFYEELPFRPDIAFDLVWRAFETLLNLFNVKVWQNSSADLHVLFRRVSEETLTSVLNNSPKLNNIVENLLRNIPLGVCRFTFIRILLNREIKTSNQFQYVKTRGINILGKEIYDCLVSEFVKNGSITAEDNHHGGILFQKMLSGGGFYIGEKQFAPLNISTRLNILLSLVLYTSRCERFHGDNFSHFKSDRTSLKTYASWYWLLLATYIVFWLLLHCTCCHKENAEIVSENSLIESFGRSLFRYENIF